MLLAGIEFTFNWILNEIIKNSYRKLIAAKHRVCAQEQNANTKKRMKKNLVLLLSRETACRDLHKSHTTKQLCNYNRIASILALPS